MYQSDDQSPASINNTHGLPAGKVTAESQAGAQLPPVMQQWKSDVFRGAAAADEASQRVFEWLHDRRQSGQAEGELTRTELLAVDADELEMFLDDLRDLQQQAEYAVEAMEAVIAAVDESDQE
jgi:hypothetical protein